MQRDMDFIRELLLEIENGKRVFDTSSDKCSIALGVEPTGLSDEEAKKLEHHLDLLQTRELVEFHRSLGGAWSVQKITWDGHDLIDSIRDEEIWKQTKEGAKKAGGFTVDLIVALAKGFAKKKIEQHTGISIDI